MSDLLVTKRFVNERRVITQDSMETQTSTLYNCNKQKDLQQIPRQMDYNSRRPEEESDTTCIWMIYGLCCCLVIGCFDKSMKEQLREMIQLFFIFITELLAKQTGGTY